LAQESQLQDITTIDAVECDSAEVDDVCFAINSLREESMQVSELLKLEDYYSKEIINELKQIMAPRKASFHLNPLTMLEQNASISSSVLNSEGVVSFLNNRGQVLFRKQLGEFQRDVFLKIIDEILPGVKSLLNSEPAKSAEGLSAIKRISMELRKIIHGESEVKQEAHKEESTPQKV
jgi:hypothetical protein